MGPCEGVKLKAVWQFAAIFLDSFFTFPSFARFEKFM